MKHKDEARTQAVINHKDADTPDELTRWIWDKYVGVPVAGDAWGQEYENLLDRVRRMDRSSFTKGLHEGAGQMKGLSSALGGQAAQYPAPPAPDVVIRCETCQEAFLYKHTEEGYSVVAHKHGAGVPAGTGADDTEKLDSLRNSLRKTVEWLKSDTALDNRAYALKWVTGFLDELIGGDSVKGEGETTER